MSYDLDDTIVAIASAPGGAARGVIRLSGPASLACVVRCFEADAGGQLPSPNGGPRRVPGAVRIANDERPLAIPCDLLAWPSIKTYTRQPSAELHVIGSPPLLAAIVDELVRCGARAAAPGEFTLRAFLGGRIDLTQAEGVLGAVDARTRRELDAALDQLAGGLSRPLHRLREELLAIVAELEAGLDFADEDIVFISRAALRAKLNAAQSIVGAAIDQLRARDHRAEAPRVVLTGLPNVGKSRLFNALVEGFGRSAPTPAIVSPQAGATRDYLVASVAFHGVPCELVDTAGWNAGVEHPIELASQDAASARRHAADLLLLCDDGSPLEAPVDGAAALAVVTKCDLLPADDRPTGEGVISCSAATGMGIVALAEAIAVRLRDLAGEDAGAAAASTAARCSGSLREAQRALAAALELVDGSGDELISAEIRAALDALGEVVGAVCADDVLDRVFSRFCIGK